MPEFNASNSYPGITQCVESSGGWFSGCFYTTPACTFYRFYATQVDKSVRSILMPEMGVLGINTTLETNEGKWDDY